MCVCGCVRLGVAGGSQYTTSCEPQCGLAVLLGGCHIRIVNSLFKTSQNPFINTSFGHMQSMVVLHVTRYSRVTLSVGPRGRRPSL